MPYKAIVVALVTIFWSPLCFAGSAEIPYCASLLSGAGPYCQVLNLTLHHTPAGASNHDYMKIEYCRRGKYMTKFWEVCDSASWCPNGPYNDQTGNWSVFVPSGNPNPVIALVELDSLTACGDLRITPLP
jgi:hypothetical protein